MSHSYEIRIPYLVKAHASEFQQFFENQLALIPSLMWRENVRIVPNRITATDRAYPNFLVFHGLGYPAGEKGAG